MAEAAAAEAITDATEKKKVVDCGSAGEESRVRAHEVIVRAYEHGCMPHTGYHV